MNYSNPNNERFYNSIMDGINLASFLIGLQNLELNISADDLSEQTNMILTDIHKYFSMQELHLADQDLRLSKLEKMLSEKKPYDRKESTR